MRVFIIDPGLQSLSGHHFGYDLLVARFCQDRHIPLYVCGHREASPEVRRRLSMLPLFRFTPYVDSGDPADVNSSGPDLQRFHRWNSIFRKDLDSLQPFRIGSLDVILFHSFRHNQLAGFTGWLRDCFPSAPPRCVLLHTIDSVVDYRTNTTHSRAKLYKAGFDPLHHYSRGDIELGGANPFLCNELELLSGLPVSLHPHLCATPTCTAKACFAAPLSATVSFLGSAREEKGFRLLPDIMLSLLGRGGIAGKNLKLQVQVPTNGPPTIETTVTQLKQLAQCETRICLIWGDIDLEQHMKLLQGSDVILLPYQPAAYKARGSNILFEAIMTGRPVIVPSGTSLSYEIDRYGAGGGQFESFDAECIALALEAVLNDLPRQIAASQVAMEMSRRANGIEHFMKYVIGDRN